MRWKNQILIDGTNPVQVHHSANPEALRYEPVLPSERARTDKPGKAILISLLVCALVCPLTAASAAVAYELRLPNGDDRYYRLEAPNSLPTRKPDPADPYYSGDRKVSEEEAIVAAIAWAGGMAEVKLPYNGSSNAGRCHCVSLGATEPGGFYYASEVRADRARYVNGPVPYYLVHLRGKIGQTEQSFYAAVLPDGRIIQPTLIRDVRHAQGGLKDTHPRPERQIIALRGGYVSSNRSRASAESPGPSTL